MKKKIVALCLVLALALTAIGGATLAYFTDTDSADNVFEIGNVKIVQNEKQRGENGLEAFEQNKPVVPGVFDKLDKAPITVDGYEFNIRNLEGNYVDKIVNVTNESTKNEAYVRTIIAVPNMNGFDDAADPTFNPLHWNYLDATDFEGTGWDWNGSNDANVDQVCYAKGVMINGASYDIYVATYNDELAAGATTSPSMVGFYLHNTFGYDDNGYFYIDGNKVRQPLTEWMNDGKLSFLVATQAVQVEGFADAWEALDAAFGAITAENHPWKS